MQDELGHGLARPHGVAQIALHQTAEIAAVLHMQRIVESQLGAQLLDVLGGGHAVFAQHHHDRIAGHELGHQKH